MSDIELDTEWKPTGRPQSTMAISFSAALDDLFKIDNSLSDLDATVSEKKKALSTQTSELEALEARLKATEERLKLAGISPITPKFTSSSMIDDKPSSLSYGPKSPLGTETKTSSRPQTKERKTIDTYAAQNMPMPGALPPTPGASEDEDSSVPEQK